MLFQTHDIKSLLPKAALYGGCVIFLENFAMGYFAEQHICFT